MQTYRGVNTKMSNFRNSICTGGACVLNKDLSTKIKYWALKCGPFVQYFSLNKIIKSIFLGLLTDSVAIR